ncbi:hypothetical protein K7432_000854 [Basidiobolus ranarum]|uniref:Uncharacterized protein n=1 Tax=Basidiobolus ranarum TaxID=34480 RepID=A0ABR2WAJ6_9FUNG
MSKTLAILFVFILLATFTFATFDSNKEHHNYGGTEKDINAHLKEHLDEEMFQQMKPEDQHYYYFTLHDLDGDEHLDGHEIRHSLTDVKVPNSIPLTLAELETIVEHVLAEDDTDGE